MELFTQFSSAKHCFLFCRVRSWVWVWWILFWKIVNFTWWNLNCGCHDYKKKIKIGWTHAQPPWPPHLKIPGYAAAHPLTVSQPHGASTFPRGFHALTNSPLWHSPLPPSEWPSCHLHSKITSHWDDIFIMTSLHSVSLTCVMSWTYCTHQALAVRQAYIAGRLHVRCMQYKVFICEIIIKQQL